MKPDDVTTLDDDEQSGCDGTDGGCANDDYLQYDEQPEDMLDEDHDERDYDERHPEEQSEDLSDPDFGPHKPHTHYCMVCDGRWWHDDPDCTAVAQVCPMHDDIP